jgi:hypothetical protein
MSVDIHGHSVEGDPIGLHYLQSLEYDELEPIINQARNKGKSGFKYDDKHYEVAHTSAGTYLVARTQSDSSW